MLLVKIQRDIRLDYNHVVKKGLMGELIISDWWSYIEHIYKTLKMHMC